MARLLTALLGLLGTVPLVAAPVPSHLFPKDPPLYYATKKGACWVYLDGEVEHRYVVTDVEKEAGDAVLVTISEVSDDKQTPFRKMLVSRRGLVWTETVGSAFDEPICMLRCPVAVGDEWKFRTSGPGGIATTEGKMRVAGVEDVEVPAGKFSAVRVEEEFRFNGDEKTKSFGTYWFAPDVGLVKADFHPGETVLKSFVPGQD